MLHTHKRKLYICLFVAVLVVISIFLFLNKKENQEVSVMLERIGTETDAAQETDNIAEEDIAEGNIIKGDSSGGNASDENEQEKVSAEEIQLSEELQKEADINEALDAMIQEMSLEEKVGQMFFIRSRGDIDASVFDTYHVGGVILFGEDFQGKTPETLIEYIQDFQNNSTYPLLIGVDEEGGTVSRLNGNSALIEAPFQSPRNLYEAGGFDAIEADTYEKSQLLLSYGINVNFAPVCDLSFSPEDFMYKRAFGMDVSETCQYVELVVGIMKEERIGSVLKHFPGYGSNGDTHTGMVTDTRDYNTFLTMDFLPFISGIQAGCDCVLVSHNIVTSMDSVYPASLSKNVHEILRNDLDFDGVIITDDLEMNGAAEFADEGEIAVLAVQAGNDMLLSSHYGIQYQAVLLAVQEGEIPETQIDASVKRILRWKYDLGLLELVNLE